MFVFTALYTKPEDPDGFLDHYDTNHAPIVARWPNVAATRLTRFTSDPMGGEPAFFLRFDALFASAEAMKDALASEAGRESGKDAIEACKRFGARVQMMLGEEAGA